MSAGEQARAALYMMALGAAIGAGYDALALLRRITQAGRIRTGMQDLLLGAATAAGMTGVALKLRMSPYRFYAFAGVAGGMTVYFMTIGRSIRHLCHEKSKMCQKS